MTDLSIRPSGDYSEEYLDRAIAAVLSLPAPDGAVRRAVEAAAGWDTVSPRISSKPLRWLVATLAASAALAIVAVGIFIANSARNDAESKIATGRDAPPPPAVVTGTDSNDDPPPIIAAPPIGQKQATPEVTRFYEPVPLTSPAWADVAPVVVTIGPDKPVKLGAVVSHKDIRSGLEPDSLRLHIWDWSKSNQSRVLPIKRNQLGSLSPAGTIMLSKSGEATDLATGAVRKVEGFAEEEGRHLWGLRFSPSGKYVVQTIHTRTKDEPPIVRWSLRLLELESGKNFGKYPVNPHAGIAFSPDEASFICSDEKHTIVRRELASGKVLNQYEPPLEPHGAVGLATSADGRFVAAGFYHGAVYLWERESGKLVVHQKFLREDGDHDRFFQPKVLKFSPDGELLAMASNSRLKILETKTGTIKAQHYHESTPAFMHLRWSPDAKSMALLTYSEVADVSIDAGFPGKSTADLLPRVYEWNWLAGGPVKKELLPPPSKGTVEEARDRTILTQEGKVFAVDANTEYVRKTDKGDVPAKFADLKSGTTIEAYQESGAKVLKRVRILGP